MYGEKLGEMAWMDLSVPDAQAVSRFYQSVLGWNSEPMPMSLDGETYHDFVMTPPKTDSAADNNESEKAPATGQAFATGICHER
ncbi:hypothetical protein [Colwellia piezophila]|uniref:hypothetical protein n=1 Tax=Colwellia piezophila TaxID=211668 RepID=UPI00039D00A4|nr:hypothetical protein [Colwellia piezophila]